jgi:chemotaxis protein CheC
MFDIRELQAVQLDALREVANIGAGHAATALSQMVDRRIMISVPRLQVARLEEVPALVDEPESIVVAVMMHVLGDLSGRTMLLLPRASAAGLSEILLRRERGSLHAFEEMEKSALKEAGNILCAAYLNALSDFMGLMLLPSVPSLVIDLCAAVMTTTASDFATERDYVFSIETEFTMDGGEAVAGHFLLLPDVQSLQVILQTVRLA